MPCPMLRIRTRKTPLLLLKRTLPYLLIKEAMHHKRLRTTLHPTPNQARHLILAMAAATLSRRHRCLSKKRYLHLRLRTRLFPTRRPKASIRRKRGAERVHQAKKRQEATIPKRLKTMNLEAEVPRIQWKLSSRWTSHRDRINTNALSPFQNISIVPSSMLRSRLLRKARYATSGHSTSSTIKPNGGNKISAAIAQVIKEAKETSAESIINIHVHLNSNEVSPVANITRSDVPAVADSPLSSEREARGSEEKRNDKEKATVSTGNNISREEHNGADELQTSVQEIQETEVAQVEIAESVEMDMDELALLSTRQCIMECRDPLSSQNPDPVIKKPRRQPRKSAGCATILSNGAAKCIRHCAEGVDEPHGCQLFSNIFSCANEADALGDIDWDSDESDTSTAQHRERRVKRPKHKKKKNHRLTREKREKEEDSSVVFDSGGLSFRLAVDLPGSDEISNDGPSQIDDESRQREDHESRDSDWEQDTIVMRRHDSSSIDSEDDKRRTTRESRQRQRHHRHKKSSSSHRDRSRRSRSRSRSASRSKRNQSPSRSRSRSRSKSGARKERRRKDSNASTHAHRNHRRPREESNHATHNRKVPPAKPPAPDEERPLSPKRKRSMKDRLRHRSHSRR